MEKFNEKANALAEEYWKLKKIMENKTGESRLEEIEKLLERGIGGKLREKLEKEARELRKRHEDINDASLRIEEVKKEIVEITAELAPNLDLMKNNFFPYDSEHEQISDIYFAALNDIFFNEPLPKIQFKEATFSKEGIEIHSHSNNSPLKILNYVITILQEAAKKKLERKNKIDQTWKQLKENEYAEYALIALEILITEGRRLKIEEIKEISQRNDREYKELVQEAYDKKLVEAVQSLAGDELEYSVLKKYNEEYEVTDFGKCVWKMCFGAAEEGNVREESSDKSNLYNLIKLFKRVKNR